MGSRNLSRVARLSLSTLSKEQQGALSLICQQRKQKSNEGGQGKIILAGTGFSFALAGIKLEAEEEKKKTMKTSIVRDMTVEGELLDITQEDKIRQHSPADKLFDYFSSYQIVDDRGKKTTLMSVRNFYNAMTPGSSISQSFGKGRSSYMTIGVDDLGAEWMTSQNELPMEGGLLNKINKKGLLTYTDYHFLFLLMSTPRRYVDMMFHAFDVSTDGIVEAKEFIYILAKIANVKTDPKELMKLENSGLIKYLFGVDLKGEVTRADFDMLQAELIDDVFTLEYTRYCPKEEKITEIDFCRHMLYSSNLTNKKKGEMIQMVSQKFGKGRGLGISFDSFKTFYHVLFGGADLERAMFFLDNDGQGVNRAEFTKIAQWVSSQDLDPHVVDVIYTLLAEDGDETLSPTEFNPVLFQWRHYRGFQKGSLSCISWII